LDIGLFEDDFISKEKTYDINSNVNQSYKDIRDVVSKDLSGVDAIVHLAAVSNDPIGNEFSAITTEINYEATCNLIDLAVKNNVKRFVYASSCSVYGLSADGARSESDEINPLTAYAISKVNSESYLKNCHGDMVATSLRFSTACGKSKRLRLDLVLNDFVAAALFEKEIKILSDGTPWRPLIDVYDMCRAIHWALLREGDPNYLAINVGANRNNFQVKDLAAEVQKLVGGNISINKNAVSDKRSYKVNFDLYERLAGDKFSASKSLTDSILEIKTLLEFSGLEDYKNEKNKFIRLHKIKQNIEKKLFNSSLRKC
jgi:nucleoside-diphosphate-sugar epimerase